MSGLDSKLTDLIDQTQKGLSQHLKPVQDHYAAIHLTAYCIRSKRLLSAILTLAKTDLHSECTSLVRDQIEMRTRAMILCSPQKDYAVKLLKWHEGLCQRLQYLGLGHFESETAHLDRVLHHADHHPEKDILRNCYGEKPQPKDTHDRWVNNWHLWDLERLLTEINTHLIESPRLRKEIQNFLKYAQDYPERATPAGIKKYAIIDDELDDVSFFAEGQMLWSQSPLAMATVATVDMLADIDAAYHLGLKDDIESYRVHMNPEHFG